MARSGDGQVVASPGFRLGRADDWPASTHEAADRYERAVAGMDSCRTQGDVDAAIATLQTAQRIFGQEMLKLDHARREAAERSLPKLDEAKLRQILDRLLKQEYLGGADPLVVEVFGKAGAMTLQDATTGFPDRQIGPAICLAQRLFPTWRIRVQIDGDGSVEAFLEDKGDTNAVDAADTRSFGSSVAHAVVEAILRALLAKAAR